MMKKFFRKILDSRVNKGEKYLLPLEELIKRSLDRVTVYPYCPVCFVSVNQKVKMVFRRSHINLIKNTPIRDDMAFKCPSCSHTLHIGKYLKEDEAQEEIRLRGGSPYLSHPTGRKDEREYKEVRKRLEKLGYVFARK